MNTGNAELAGTFALDPTTLANVPSCVIAPLEAALEKWQRTLDEVRGVDDTLEAMALEEVEKLAGAVLTARERLALGRKPRDPSTDTETAIRAAAALQYAGLGEQQIALIKFGMIPIELTRDPLLNSIDADSATMARLHSVALMDCANADGGMVV